MVALEQAVAAPLCSRHLADMGADVVKVEPPGGDFARGYDSVVEGLSSYFVWLNRGKRSLGLDLHLPDGLAVLWRLLGAADVLILDEPLNGLDVEMMRKLRLRIEDDKRSGRSFLISSHVMSFVERISDRVGIMRAGRLVAEGPPAELRLAAGLPDALFEDVFFHLAG